MGVAGLLWIVVHIKKMSLRLGVYTLLLASLVLLAQQQKADARKSVKKGLSNAIDLGPSYSSHHKAERKLSQLANKGKKYKNWTHKLKSGLVRIAKDKKVVFKANTRHDQDNIHLQRLDSTTHNNKNTPHNSTNAFTNHTSIKSVNSKTAVARDAAKKVKNVKAGRKKLDKSRKKMQRIQKKLTREKRMRSKLEKP